MGYLNGTTVSITGDNLVDSMTNGYKWQLDSTRTIDWSLSGGDNGEFWNDPNEIHRIMNNAFDSIEQFVNVTFNYVGHFADPGRARNAGSDINVTADFENEHVLPGYDAAGYFPKPNDPNRGDIFFDGNTWNSLPSFEPGSDAFSLILHEIGHALGLKHPHDSGGTGRPTFNAVAWGNLDDEFFTVMSYEDDDFDLNAYDPGTPMILDVLALQYLYGASKTNYNGNTTWSFVRNDKYTTVYDSAGIDTIDQSDADEGWVIDLPDLILSDLVKTKVGMVISQADNKLAVPTDFSWLAGNFENAIGSAYADIIHGNRLKNDLRGGGGRDVLKGGRNDDKLFGDNGMDKLSGGAGDDVLKGGNRNDRLFGGSGEDRFVFKTGWDVDTIKDFDATGRVHDVLDLRGLKSVKSWTDLKRNHLEKDGSDVVIDGRNGDVIILEDVTLKSLDKGDFIF